MPTTFPRSPKSRAILFGVCVTGINGVVHAMGDTNYEFSIQSVSKPFVFALVCQAIGEDEAREKLGVIVPGCHLIRSSPSSELTRERQIRWLMPERSPQPA